MIFANKKTRGVIVQHDLDPTTGKPGQIVKAGVNAFVTKDDMLCGMDRQGRTIVVCPKDAVSLAFVEEDKHG